MLNLIRQILEKWGCRHKWKVHFSGKRDVKIEDGMGQMIRAYTRYSQTLICTKCGKIRRIEL